MTNNNHNEPSQNSGALQKIKTVTKDEFATINFESPIANSKKVDCVDLSILYGKAANREKEAGNEVAVRVFQILKEVCQIHFKPDDNAEPYGPMGVSHNQRTMIPSDLKGDQSKVFSEVVSDIRNPGLRARLSDIAWLNNRKLPNTAREAIRAYCEAIQLVRDDKAEFSSGEQGASSHSGCQMLRRSCQISKIIGWKDPEGSELKTLIQAVTTDALNRKDFRGYLNIGTLSLDFNIENPFTIAENAEIMVSSGINDPYDARQLWKLAARGYRYAQKDEEFNRCMSNASECYVTMASAANFKGMVAASWLMEAIKELRKIPNTKKRRQELEVILRDAQASIPDEMVEISTDFDPSDLVEYAQNKVAGFTLAKALAEFANLENSPEVMKLYEDVKKQAEEHPLQSMISMSIHDDEGKVISESPGLSIGEEDDESAIRHLIARNEVMRRQLTVYGLIEPARQKINSEHLLEQRYFQPIVCISPFVPADRTDLFSLGFARFFNGDFISALHILVPQLEHSLRYIIEQAGIDSSRIKNDMTQENRTLSTMLEKDREMLEKIFGSAIIFEIENIFDFRGGPAIRHQVAHGLISGNECHTPDSIYACWFIFRLCCLPIFPHWQQITDWLNEL